MAGNKGRGHAAYTFNIEAVGFSRGEKLLEVLLKPPPLFLDTDYKTVPLKKGESEYYVLHSNNNAIIKYFTNFLKIYTLQKPNKLIRCLLNEQSKYNIHNDLTISFGKQTTWVQFLKWRQLEFRESIPNKKAMEKNHRKAENLGGGVRVQDTGSSEEVKSKGEKEKYKHLNTEFQREQEEIRQPSSVLDYLNTYLKDSWPQNIRIYKDTHTHV
ncbi:hypothetical protein JEQ12_015297 [Ovis aries]|uniref:Uncharacterized protein n=1 Tax=Ovis aries TaxID=9940 RepID=A0A836AGD4_SHEEP|nr:hypothetical protein JEQ12_015297 [Ovis aries]